MKRVLIIAPIVIAVAIFIVLGAMRGARADRCAEELIAHIKDRAYLEKVIRSPTLPEELAAAHHIELGFVRPLESNTARVGLFVRRTATTTQAAVVVLMLEGEEKGEACAFFRDYETGPFGR